MTPEQREKRLYHHMYETCEGIREQSERIVALEELVLDMLRWMPCPRACRMCERFAYPEGCEFQTRADELEVADD